MSRPSASVLSRATPLMQRKARALLVQMERFVSSGGNFSVMPAISSMPASPSGQHGQHGQLGRDEATLVTSVRNAVVLGLDWTDFARAAADSARRDAEDAVDVAGAIVAALEAAKEKLVGKYEDKDNWELFCISLVNACQSLRAFQDFFWYPLAKYAADLLHVWARLNKACQSDPYNEMLCATCLTLALPGLASDLLASNKDQFIALKLELRERVLDDSSIIRMARVKFLDALDIMQDAINGNQDGSGAGALKLEKASRRNSYSMLHLLSGDGDNVPLPICNWDDDLRDEPAMSKEYIAQSPALGLQRKAPVIESNPDLLPIETPQSMLEKARKNQCSSPKKLFEPKEVKNEFPTPEKQSTTERDRGYQKNTNTSCIMGDAMVWGNKYRANSPLPSPKEEIKAHCTFNSIISDTANSSDDVVVEHIRDIT